MVRGPLQRLVCLVGAAALRIGGLNTHVCVPPVDHTDRGSLGPFTPYSEAGYGHFRPVPEVVSSVSRSVARELTPLAHCIRLSKDDGR